MEQEEKSVVWTIGRWLLESISANDLDRLMDHMNQERLNTDRQNDIANELALAMGYRGL